MAIKRTATTAQSARRMPAKATATKAPAKATSTAKATAKTATPKTDELMKQTRTRHNFGEKTLVKVDKKTSFPGVTRQSTRNSPYADSIASIVNTEEFLVFDGVSSKEEFTSFANTLRNLAKRNHQRSLTVIWLEKDTPTHPAGVYVKDGGEIKTRETGK